MNQWSVIIYRLLIDTQKIVLILLLADMSTDEWSIDAEGKYNSNTTVYSPALCSYMFCAIQMEFHFIYFF